MSSDVNPPTMRFKVCLLGAPGVGKTSLSKRFVEGIFDERYITTLGVKIDRKFVETASGAASLIIWDIHGEEASISVSKKYLRGMAGFLLVTDASRPETVGAAQTLRDRVHETCGPDIPFVMVMNKADLVDDWAPVDDANAALGDGAIATLRTSAMHGHHVEDAFTYLAAAMHSEAVRI